MESRRSFLKYAGLGAAGLLGPFDNYVKAHSEMLANPDLSSMLNDYSRTRTQVRNMAGYCAPKIDLVRCGIIGLGNRGTSQISDLSRIEGVEIRAICDVRQSRVDYIREFLKPKGHKPKEYVGDKNEWKHLCEQKDLDLILIFTPFYMHAEMCIFAMENGKHAYSAVPAAGTLEECWKIVETSERTGKHCMMPENISYLDFQLIMLNMAYKNFFGQIVHGEGAYNTSKVNNNFSKTMYWNFWWLKQYAYRKGNIYPTHSLGPIALMMDINRGDRLDFLVSIESDDFYMAKHAAELAKKDDDYKPFEGLDYRGNMNLTLIRTKMGKTIMIEHDATTPSPHNYMHGIYGMKGAATAEPIQRISTGKHKWVPKEEFEQLKKEYTPAIAKKFKDVPSGHGGTDLLMTWKVIDSLRNGAPIEHDVYDAAAWSSIVPLSEWSVTHNSNQIIIPDFTAGKWETNTHRMDLDLKYGNTTKFKK